MTELPFWCELDVRIVHANLDPKDVTNLLSLIPRISQKPGESKIHFQNCESAGYYCAVHRVEFPEKPDVAILWAEQLCAKRSREIRQMLNLGYEINLQLAVWLNVLSLGFSFPATPTINSLGIPLGVEFYSR